MPVMTRSAVADATGTATVDVFDIPSGLIWVVSQTSVEALTAQVSVTATIRKNGRYITSTNQGNSSSAGGQPFIRLAAGDHYTVTWTGLIQGDTAILNLLYNEFSWADAEAANITVV